MVAQRIQGNYDCLEETMRVFMRHADMTVALTFQIEGLVDQLQGGAWRGVGAEAFYVEMGDLILPAMRKLEDALQFAGEGTGKIHHILREAEEEAARLFRGEGGAIARTVPPSFPGVTSQQVSDVRQQLIDLLKHLYKPDDTYSKHFKGDIPTLFADLILAAYTRGAINNDTLNSLLLKAQSGDRGALAALFGIALANAQGKNFIEFENKTGIAYYGSSGLMIKRLGQPEGGNCATFISTLLFLSGMERYKMENDPDLKFSWLLGYLHPSYRFLGNKNGEPDLTANSLGGLFQGSIPFRTVGALDTIFQLRSDGKRFKYDSNTVLTQGNPIPDNIKNKINAGDLIYTFFGNSRGAADPRNHVALIVGWGPASPNFQLSSSATVPSLFPTFQEAQDYYKNQGIEITPWAIDHGGDSPDGYGYPRPYGQTVTGNSSDKDRSIVFADLEYK